MMTGKTYKELYENQQRLNSCKLHKFDLGPPPYIIGQKHTCLNCGGSENLTAIFDYCKGYKAAGKNPNDIVENFQ